MRFEELLSEVGGFSWFQLRIVLLLCIPRIILPFHFLLHNFISAVPSHRCSLYPSENASTFYMDTERLKGSIPREADGSLSSCRAFLPQQSTNASEGPSALLPCQYGWVYDKSQLTSTTATEWDLVCDNKTQNQVLAMYFFIGVTLGAIIFGYCSDKFGWKAMLLVLFVASAIFGTMSAFSVSYVMFAVTRTLCGVALTGMSIISIVLSLEWIDVKHHTFTGTIIGLSWNVGSMLLALVAYFIRDWRHLLLAVTSPCILAIISWWWIPESVRWQVTNRHITKAHKQLLNCAKMNGKHQFASCITTETISKITFAEDSIQNYSYVHLVKTPKMRRLVFCSGIVWFGVALSYYGISLKISGFGVNIYLTQFIYGAIEVPAKCATYFALNKIGRRKGQAWSLIITGVLIGLNTLIPAEQEWIRTFIAVLGKGFSEASFTIAFLYTAELFPTVLRQSGLGYTSFMGRMGVSLAPLVIILEDIWSSLPSAIFSTAAILCGCTAFLLSETHNFRLPETVADVEQDKHKLDPVNDIQEEINGIAMNSVIRSELL
ncbi:solute carrier family 22 member 7-like isoform X1 [Erpetoichthys calabaricus]|uniref:solute carrier family 22 member 7-like isoform X1 n=2 Tax=Erpetoichthys calabaricus TaxID=27687 RepID=UPI00223426B5|nr:solute carrier family 22 member 7-like isoform X1 [Erpetoichthys calabaricus]XP_028676063.2 solute carrier family 22 member 7-like isoform X1 [Erpetoichthys calabaricus]XP_028676064.2 solute carrier family 22 member 7-like isoform X1 [Erpetoichthys calabaricus]